MVSPELNGITSPRPTFTSSQPNHQRPSTSRSNSTSALAVAGSAPSSRRQSQQLPTGSEQFPAMPQRHSRPMTPAELHDELEREQEGIVNRLTRELQSLRAHRSSITSNTSAHSTTSNPTASSTVGANTSSTSPAIAQFFPPPSLMATVDPLAAPHTTIPLLTTAPSLSQPIISPRHPTTTRQHRSSSSSMSSRTHSMTSSSPAFSVPTSMANSTAAPFGSSQASVDRARDAAGIHAPSPHFPSGFHVPRSRQGSMRSAQPSPAPSMTVSLSDSGARRPSVSLTGTRAEEAAAARKSLEDALAEHEELIKRVKELEQELRSLGVEESRGRAPARGVLSS